MLPESFVHTKQADQQQHAGMYSAGHSCATRVTQLNAVINSMHNLMQTAVVNATDPYIFKVPFSSVGDGADFRIDLMNNNGLSMTFLNTSIPAFTMDLSGVSCTEDDVVLDMFLVFFIMRVADILTTPDQIVDLVKRSQEQLNAKLKCMADKQGERGDAFGGGKGCCPVHGECSKSKTPKSPSTATRRTR